MLRADQGPERGAIVTSGRNPVKYLENKICLHATVCTLSLTMGALATSGPECVAALHHSGRRTTEGLHRLSDPN